VKNALFAGSSGGAEHWAMIGSIIETCKMCGVEPFAYLKDVLTKITNGHTINRIAELAPWAYMTDTQKPTDNPHHHHAPAPAPDLPPSIIPAP
jgi:hypothetical protein